MLPVAMSGLGEKKIVFRKNGKGCHIHEKLLENFPKPKDGGGYELLGTKERGRHLKLIPYPRLHYWLSKKYSQSQAKAYVPPFQKNLSLSVNSPPCQVNYVLLKQL